MVLLQVMGGVWAGGVYYPGSAGGGVGVEAEEVEEALLGGVEVGEHAAGAGPAAFALVEHGVLRCRRGVEEVRGRRCGGRRGRLRGRMRRATARASTQ